MSFFIDISSCGMWRKEMKINCAVIMYNPKSDVLNKIQEYAVLFDTVYVYDNTERLAIDFQLVDQIKKIPRVIYMGEGINIGLPKAYNHILKNIPDDVAFLCTMDQDSVFPVEDIKEMIKVLEKLPAKIAIVGPNIIYGKEKTEKDYTFEYKRYVISSGSFVNLALLRKERILYDTAYFIDRFDADLCEQFRRKGYDIAQYQGAFLFQELGERDNKGRSNHSMLRHYYIFRNRFYYNNKYYEFPKKQAMNFFQTAHHIMLIICNENYKYAKLKQLIPAIRDYKNGKMEEQHGV